MISCTDAHVLDKIMRINCKSYGQFTSVTIQQVGPYAGYEHTSALTHRRPSLMSS
jgi:hypothetical protein